ncbi:MAG: hypothetical protein ABSA43_00800 [Candidatus Microgenomates bacterium]|jgi:hypothetical protein
MSDKKILTIVYHDIFDFPLTTSELEKWKADDKLAIPAGRQKIENKSGFYFLKGREELIGERLEKEKIAKKKMKIARRSARILGLIPSIRLVGVTGALAMANTEERSDIDLMLVTSADTLWLTRLISYALLSLTGFKIRRPGGINEKDKLCLNMWLDEDSLTWPVKERSLYSAHELGQLVPLVTKNNLYEYLMWENGWLKDYWPNIKIVNSAKRIARSKNKILKFFNQLAFWVQKRYMTGKITREVVTESKAIFHPVDWNHKIQLALQKRGIMM